MLTTGISQDKALSDKVGNSIQRVWLLFRSINSGFIIQRFT